MLNKLLLALTLLVGAFVLAPTSGQAAVPFGTAATVAGENTLKAEPVRYRRYRHYGYRHYRPRYRYYRPRYYQRRYYAPRRFYGHRRFWF